MKEKVVIIVRGKLFLFIHLRIVDLIFALRYVPF